MSHSYPRPPDSFEYVNCPPKLTMKNITLVFVFLSTFVNAQSTFPFDIVLDAVTINGAPGLQSYSKAEHNGDWLILGGRTDGLHQRQPWQAFDAAGHHLNAVVISPDSSTVH